MKRVGLLFMAVWWVCATFSYAVETPCAYPTPCYQGQELKALRAWEKTWVEKKITSENVSAVKEYLPDSFFQLMTDTATWQASWFTIVAYQPIEPTPGTRAQTLRFCGKPSINTDGVIQNWTSGVPFPKPATGIEMAYNFRTRNYGDAYKSDERGYLIDGIYKYDMGLHIKNQFIHYAGRTDTPPVPEFADNPKQLWRAFHMQQLAPPEARNLRIIELQYKDKTKPYDSWVWVSALRRIRRRSTSERQDALGGADFCGFDNQGWSGPAVFNNYRYVGRRDLLLARHTNTGKLVHTPGKCLFDGTQRERINTYVIEAVNKDPNFLYSKMIWYLDPETWQILYSDRYDRDGKIWKVLDQYGFVSPGYNNVPVNYFNGSQMVDMQRRHSTAAVAEYTFGQSLDPRIFTLQYLQKYGY